MNPRPKARRAVDLAAVPRDWQVTVVSPHLDDAVLSVGATISALTRRGVSVRVCTVFAGLPTECGQPLDASHRRAGFSSAQESASARRIEDARACAAVGAQPVWLNLPDGENLPRDPDVVRRQLQAQITRSQLVLAPGHPASHPDHAIVREVVRGFDESGTRVAYYVEQPYAAWQNLSKASLGAGGRRPTGGTRDDGVPDEYTVLRPGTAAADHLRKFRAMSCYGSQLAVLRKLPRTRIAADELLRGGEAVAWPPDVARRLTGQGGQPDRPETDTREDGAHA